MLLHAGALLYAVLPNVAEVAVHAQGTYVIQKLSEHGSAMEVRARESERGESEVKEE